MFVKPSEKPRYMEREMISFRDAAKHAADCGSLGACMLAYPISDNAAKNPKSVQLAADCLDPADCRIIARCGDVMSAAQLAKMAEEYGLDYVVIRV